MTVSLPTTSKTPTYKMTNYTLIILTVIILLIILGGLAWCMYKIGGFVTRIEIAATSVSTIKERLDLVPQIHQLVVFAHKRIDRLEQIEKLQPIRAADPSIIPPNGE
jgi:hypothetical protein